MASQLHTLLYLSCLGVCICCTSDDDDESPATRRIANESGYSVTLEIVDSEAPDTLVFQIPDQDTLSLTGSCQYGEDQFCAIGWSGSANYVRMQFANQRELVDASPFNSTRNVGTDPSMTLAGYDVDRDGDMRIYTFTISEADFELAEPL